MQKSTTVSSIIHKPHPGTRGPKLPAFQGIIFDIDNVLIDTRYSYLEAIRWTVDLFLTCGKIPFFQPDKKSSGPQILTPGDISQFKLLGGFNDDWDCCYGLLVYLISLPVKVRRISDLKKMIKLKKFTGQIQNRPLGVSGIVQKLGNPQRITVERISRIFQEVYLGKDLFEKIEKRRAVFWSRRGLIHKEKLIFRKTTLEKLVSMGISLGITTGRSRFEALYALKRFGIDHLFQAVTTMDEIRKEESLQTKSLRKPHPFSLIETAKKLGLQKRFLYIGDLPDDVMTAQRAKDQISVCSVGFPWFSGDTHFAVAEMKKIGSDFFLEKPGDLPRMAQSGKPLTGS